MEHFCVYVTSDTFPLKDVAIGMTQRGAGRELVETLGDMAGRSGTTRGIEVPASLTVFGAPAAHTRATVVRYSPGRRAARALLAVGACWGLALLAVFIPVAHFVLVPGLLVIGLILATSRAREAWRVVTVQGQCPRCRRDGIFPSASRARGQWVVHCPDGKNELALTIEPGPGGI